MLKFKNFIAGAVCPGLTPPKIYIHQLEEEINKWLADNPNIQVVQMTQGKIYQSDEPGHWSYEIMLSFLYKEG